MKRVLLVLFILLLFSQGAWAADTALSGLSSLGTTPAANDEMYIGDVSEAVATDRSKKITYATVMSGNAATATALAANGANCAAGQSPLGVDASGAVEGCIDLPNTYQPLEATLTDIADGAIAEDLDNTANPWADDEVVDDITLTNLSQITTKPITGLSATNWRVFYSADGAVPVELALGAAGTYLGSNGAAAAPTWTVPSTVGLDNVTYVPIAGDINTYIAAATAGDTLVLSAGDYTITSDIVVSKQLNIYGQGNAGLYSVVETDLHGTRIFCDTNDVSIFNITASNVRIADLSIITQGGGTAARGIETANNLDGLVFTNIDVVMESGAGTKTAFDILGSHAVLRGLTFYVTSTNSTAYGLYVHNDSSTTQDAVVDAHAVSGTTVGGSTRSCPFYVYNNNDANTITLNLFSSWGKATTGTANDVGAYVNSTTTNNAVMSIYNSTLDGEEYDIQQSGTNSVSIYGGILVNALTSGTITYGGEMAIANISATTTSGGKYIYRADGTDVPVVDGGTGAGTFTDGGILIGNAANAFEATAAGLTTEILVGGGAASAPVWTAATGTGAPVRATAPTIDSPVITTAITATGLLADVHMANDAMDPDKLVGDTVDDDLIDQAAIAGFGEATAPKWTFTDSDAGATATAIIDVVSTDGASEDSILQLTVTDSGGVGQVYLELDGVDEQIQPQKPINMGALAFISTGTIMGAVKINIDADGMTQGEMTTAGMYGTMYFATGAGTWNLPAAAAGMSFCLYSTTAAAIIINPDDADTITYDGLKDDAGHQIASPEAAGDYICMIAYDATDWYTLGHSGTWVPGS